ncbi:bifunctional DNA-formamidopyrimidine glycosylase/DNA-(apurinic or apyrimidinic site) lyase [Phaeovulum sp. W22_SRMD_FR3]|uniref:bifunctional DNA-formamidopyrimidine glycosylase/DNA-(apurinic or apyrimidinic site) lyase n=1 Tax=Phaeovulum sp. W22_SRMD_FR3 TaxID=3240274 RepID=UPI003F99D0A9
MPELPEVETVRRGLAPAMEGARIARAEVNRPDLRWPFPERMAERLTGARILALRRRSKYLLLDLDTGETLLIHLGMSGRMQVSGAPVGDFYHPHPAPLKHDHVVFHLDGGARVTFNDARRFGAMDLMETAQEAGHWLIRDIGPEPLGNDFHETYLAARLAGRASPLKTLLLDQQIVAGLGNIYVSEALYRASLDPRRAGRSVTSAEVSRLVPVIRQVLGEAIEAGGSSLRDHRQADGNLGYFQHTFRVYDREGAPCPTPGCSGHILRIVQSGRSSFLCPLCQR